MKETFKDLVHYDREYVLPTYSREILLERGQGSRLWDIYGNEYLDFTTGISVCNLGHCHPGVTAAIREQAGKLVHVSNLFYNEHQPRLAKVIAERSGLNGKVFFGNSGAEANEGLIKFARRWGHQNGGKYSIICCNHCFHGRTLATLAATAKLKYREGYAPDMAGFTFVEFNNLSAVEAAITAETAAVLVEVVQGEGGVNPATADFLLGLRQLCDERKLLLLLDEVQCGMGRTGKYFSFQHYDFIPDGFSMAKALGNGFPMGAFCIQAQYGNLFSPGSHGSTFGGTPLACAAALAVFAALEEEQILENVQAQSKYFFQRLRVLQQRFPLIKDVRGLGLLVGVEVGTEAIAGLQKACLQRRLLTLSAGEGVLRLLPPLNVAQAEIDQACAILQSALEDCRQAR
jgi:acetylornithine/N-succinyldiaminopimelate aminotransferase